MIIMALLLAAAPAPVLDPSHAPFLPTVPGLANPLVTQDNLDQTICNKTLFDKNGVPIPLIEGKPTKPGFTWVHLQRPPTSYTNKIKFALMDALGIPRSQSKLFELDHDWSIEDGGSPSSVLNLWLQPYAGPYGAKLKDRIENREHDLICGRVITLEQAGQDLTGDWIAAYNIRIGAIK